MNAPRNQSGRRRLFALLLLACVAAFSGCVYLRLLDLKKQFSRFDQHFKADLTDGLRIECLDPLLQVGDARWLGIFPESITTAGTAEDWRVRWVKESSPGPLETSVYDVELSARFVDGRLARVGIPERYFAFCSKELFLNLLRSTGEARIDRSSRSAEVDNKPATEGPQPKLPTIESIDGMLGRPTEFTKKEGLTIYRYRYKPMTTEKKARSLEVSFAFNDSTGFLQTLTAKLPTGTIHFRVAPPAKP